MCEIQRENDIESMMNFLGDGGGCGITNSDVTDWMESVQNSAVTDEPPKTSTNQKEAKPNITPWNGDREDPGHKYSREANEPSHRRPRRATRSEENNTCSLFIQTDPLIWRHISEQVREIYFKSITHEYIIGKTSFKFF